MKNYNLLLRRVVFLFFLAQTFNQALSQSEIIGFTFLGTHDGHAYYLSECFAFWPDAADAAAQMNGYLAIINNQEENDFLGQLAPTVSPSNFPCNSNYCFESVCNFDGGAWIGLQSTLTQSCNYWEWQNGELLGYTNWAINFAEYLPEPEPVNLYCGAAVFIGDCWCNACDPSINQYAWRTSNPSYPRKYIVEFDHDPGCGNPNKSYICHNGNTICVNNDAVAAHLNHGDVLGPCLPCLPLELSSSNPVLINEAAKHSSPLSPDHNQDLLSYNKQKPSIFPNPVTNAISIHIPEEIKSGKIHIHSSTKLVSVTAFQSGHSMCIEMSQQPPGLYIITLHSDDLIWQEKFVKL